MKILFDHQAYIEQNFGGVSRYFFELTKGLISDWDVNVDNAVYLSNNIYTNNHLYSSKKFLPEFNFKGKGTIMRNINKTCIKTKFNSNYDIFHPTYYDTYFLNKISNKPFVITFHDLIHEKFSSRFNSLKKENFLFKRRKLLLENAPIVIAVSENTKNDIVDIYNINPNKIKVSYLASSIEKNNDPLPIPYSNYILYVGNRWSYKNFKEFVNAIVPLLKKEPTLKILCAGGGSFNHEELIFFNNHKILNNLIQIPIDDKLLSILYSNALFFVFPSLYEGFGIPLLEAFSCSCAALISNTSSLAEVGGNAALYFDPDNKDDILDKVTKVLYDTELVKKLKVAGLERQKLFTWKKTVKNHIEAYNSLL